MIYGRRLGTSNYTDEIQINQVIFRARNHLFSRKEDGPVEKVLERNLSEI